ncbi:hypothetical protein [Vibrio fluvialis]|uniref:hypothetical protein n=1 Tax=Vibrio fluvialis TaxID=676 RepID=UPI00192CA47D|nr:hypothetical protein [Vibrio fluvialis]MBL4307019.1 hypothetical protein [Vibrio fluvialis]
MSDKATFITTLMQYDEFNDEPEIQRMMAVAAAMELIKSEVSSSRERNSSSLEHHFSKLSEYADHIQKALKSS